jgi:hypothetical protein
MPGYEREVREYLRANGCYSVRKGKGDHEIWHSPITNRNITVDGEIKVAAHRERGSQAGRYRQEVLTPSADPARGLTVAASVSAR